MKKAKNRKGQMQVFLILFSLIMGIGLLSAFTKILDFESRANDAMNLLQEAKQFENDYMLAMNSPADEVVVCHRPYLEDCTIKFTVMQEDWLYRIQSNRHPTGVDVPYPRVTISLNGEDMKVTIPMPLQIVQENPTGFHGYYIFEPEINSPKCREYTEHVGAYAARTVDYRECEFECGHPIEISKKREYDTTSGIWVEKMAVKWEHGDQCE